MPTKRVVTKVTEYEYSEDGFLVRETETVTTEEQETPVAPWRQGPHIHFPPRQSPYESPYKAQWWTPGYAGYGHGLKIWDPKDIRTTTMNGHE